MRSTKPVPKSSLSWNGKTMCVYINFKYKVDFMQFDILIIVGASFLTLFFDSYYQ